MSKDRDCTNSSDITKLQLSHLQIWRHLIECSLDCSLAFSVQSRRCLIQKQNLRVSHQSSSNCYALLLTAAQLRPTLSHQCVVFLPRFTNRQFITTYHTIYNNKNVKRKTAQNQNRNETLSMHIRLAG